MIPLTIITPSKHVINTHTRVKVKSESPKMYELIIESFIAPQFIIHTDNFGEINKHYIQSTIQIAEILNLMFEPSISRTLLSLRPLFENVIEALPGHPAPDKAYIESLLTAYRMLNQYNIKERK